VTARARARARARALRRRLGPAGPAAEREGRLLGADRGEDVEHDTFPALHEAADDVDGGDRLERRRARGEDGHDGAGGEVGGAQTARHLADAEAGEHRRAVVVGVAEEDAAARLDDLAALEREGASASRKR
jgi:hypothetical protein